MSLLNFFSRLKKRVSKKTNSEESYILYYEYYPNEYIVIEHSLDDIKQELATMFKETFAIVEEGDWRLKEPFRFISRVKLESIDSMDFRELKNLLYEYGYILEVGKKLAYN